MHAMGNIIDMRRFSGLRRVLPTTHWTFLCGASALAGFPLLSGFWSKDVILDVAHEAGHKNQTYTLLLYSGIITAALTAFYTFRAYFRTFWGELVVPPEAGSHGHDDHDDAHGHAHEPAPAAYSPVSGAITAAPLLSQSVTTDPAAAHGGPGKAHESPAIMTVPLMILAVFAVGVGGFLGPTQAFLHFVGKTQYFPFITEEPHENVPMMITSSLIAIGGIFLAWLMYVKMPDLPGKVAGAMQGAYQMSLNKFHFDELYATFILGPLAGLTWLIGVVDKFVIDGLVDLCGEVPAMIGKLFRPVQNGLVQFYALAMMLGLTVFIIALVRSL
jgi:NADH-quinone oxidoreductase subunit L